MAHEPSVEQHGKRDRAGDFTGSTRSVFCRVLLHTEKQVKGSRATIEPCGAIATKVCGCMGAPGANEQGPGKDERGGRVLYAGSRCRRQLFAGLSLPG